MKGPTMAQNFTLSPSDFAFLWQECGRCFYLKYVAGYKRPFGAFPSIFGAIDGAMRDRFMGAPTGDLTPDLPPGTVTHGEKWVHSQPIHRDGHSATLTIRGKFDTVVTFDDGSYGVIDFKTSNIKPQSVRLYSRQLRAYAYALENPLPGKLSLSPITVMGLLSYTPDTFDAEASTRANEKGRAVLGGTLNWHAIKRNTTSFMAFLDEVLTLLELPEAPEADPKCNWCQYRESARLTGF